MIFLIFFIGIIVHEFVHGISWAQFASKGLKSMKYGINFKYMTPYCHCKEPLLVKDYIFGILMPAILLGFIPCIVAIFIGSCGLLVLGVMMTFAAGGDFIIAKLLINEPKTDFVLDHPTKVGCYIYRA